MSGKKLYLLLLVVGIMTILGLFVSLGYERTWRIWNIPVMQPAFYDLRLITGGAESYAEGYDPAFENPYDPEQRLFNYPRIWYLVLATGIDQQDTLLIGILLTLGFFICLTTLRGEFELITAIVMALVIFSPAVLLGIERGNVDLAIFILLALALWGIDISKTLSLLVLLFAVVLKLYPILGVGYLLDENKHSVKYTIVGILASAAYVVFNWEDMMHIFSDTQKGADVSYGVSVLPTKLLPYLGNYHGTVKLVLYLIAIGLILVLGYLAFRNKDQIVADNSNQLSMFRLGAGIYLGTFLLGNNWDYRLMFLIFAIPQIVGWAKDHTGFTSLVAKICVVTIFASFWYLEIWRISEYAGMAGRVVSFLLDECMNWALFAGLIYLYIKSLPAYVAALVQTVLGQHFTHKQQKI